MDARWRRELVGVDCEERAAAGLDAEQEALDSGSRASRASSPSSTNTPSSVTATVRLDGARSSSDTQLASVLRAPTRSSGEPEKVFAAVIAEHVDITRVLLP
jgi:hypothetical protein